MGHECWDDPRKLTYERTGFRDWKVSVKDSLRQRTECKASTIMDVIEMPTMGVGETAETPEEICEEVVLGEEGKRIWKQKGFGFQWIQKGFSPKGKGETPAYGNVPFHAICNICWVF